MELKRKCESNIKEWYRNSNKALLVKGARQVGKTHLIRRVLAEEGCDTFEVNLIETPEAISILEQALTVYLMTRTRSPYFSPKSAMAPI